MAPRARALAAVLVLLLAARARAEAPAVAAAPPAFAPGEETVFEVSYLGLRTGQGRILVGTPAGDVWPVIFQARTDGLASLFDIREHLVTYWDVPSGLPRGSDLWAREPGDEHQDRVRFDRTAGTATVTVRRNGRTREDVVAVPAGAQDLTSVVMWLRQQPLEAGQRLTVPVVAGTGHFELEAEVVGRERVSTPAGTFATLKLRVRTRFQGSFSTRRDSTVWLSDDPRHVLVKASAEFAVGSVVAELTRYHPGARVASAE